MSLETELGEPSLRDFALVAVAYGSSSEPGATGVLGVIGPQRMDYGRVIPLVHYCSELVTRKLMV
jgi:transcriptional regulator of heat shock response